MGEAVDSIPSILNKCLFVSPGRRTDGLTQRLEYTPAVRAILFRLKTHTIQARLRELVGIYLKNLYRLRLFQN